MAITTYAELQTAINALLKHARVPKRSWFGRFGNDAADGAFSDCLGRLLYEQARRAGAMSNAEITGAESVRVD